MGSSAAFFSPLSTLLALFLCLPLYAPGGVTGSVGEIRWFPTTNVKIDRTIGKGTMADVVPIHGEGIAENRVAKLYRWDLTELGKRPEGANLADSTVLQLLNGYERVREVLGNEALEVDGAINWNNGNKGIIMEELPQEAELFDVKEGLYRSKYATPETVERFGAAMDKLIAAKLFHHDIHVAILPNGSLKFYDSDLARPMDSPDVRYWANARDPMTVMNEVKTSGIKILKEVIAKRDTCPTVFAHVAEGAPAPHFPLAPKQAPSRANRLLVPRN